MPIKPPNTPKGWRVITNAGPHKLERRFAFADFKSALAFVDRVGVLAEQADHHPDINLSWGQATVAWWSHDVGGLSERDYKMAEKTNQAFEQI